LHIPAAQKKSQAMHDTHGQYAKMARYTPAELSRMKAEKDTKEQEQLNFVRQRQQQQELQRQQMLQQARMPMVGTVVMEMHL
jgi:chromatin modification-related protein VID21